MSETGPVFFYEPEFYMLSNFSAHAIVFDGIFYPTAEHAYQAQKFDQQHIRVFISKEFSPHTAKNVAHAFPEVYRKDWCQELKLDVMGKILRKKLLTHNEVRGALLKTGQREIIENSPTDSFWGWGPDRQGQNHLGKIWMKIRAEIEQFASEEKEGASK